jgi:hypothetical protein
VALRFYVKSLVVLLKDLGVDQNAIARQLRTSASVVSYWSTGRRPLPTRHKRPFHDLVAAAIRTDRAKPGSRAAHDRRIRPHLHAWGVEMYVRTDDYHQEIREDLSTLRNPLATKDPFDMPRDERQRLQQAAARLAGRLSLLDVDVAWDATFRERIESNLEFEALWQLFEGYREGEDR